MGTAAAEFSSDDGVRPMLRTTTTTIIYLNNAWLSNEWEVQKNDFFHSEGSEKSPASVQDEIFFSHLLQIHARFCIDPTCKKENCPKVEEEINMTPAQSEIFEQKISLHGQHSNDTMIMQIGAEIPEDTKLARIRMSFGEGTSGMMDGHRNVDEELNSDGVPDADISTVPPDTSHDQTEISDNVTIKEEEDAENDEIIDECSREMTSSLNTPSSTHGPRMETQSHPELSGMPLQVRRTRKQTAKNCHDCEKTFGQSHLKYDGMQIGRQYHCDECSKSFWKKSDLDRHMQKHSEERPYHCEFLSKSFSQSSDLRNQRRTHTREKPFQCDVCLKSFLHLSHLYTHRKIHSGEKTHQCGVCSKSFSQMSNMKTHMRTHTNERPYQCNVCLRSFSRKYTLDSHRRTHTGEKPYHCEICSKSFSQLNILLSHRRTHTGEKPYQCDICSKAFSQMNHLRTHRRTHTGEKHVSL